MELLLCKCVFLLILVGVLFKGSRDGWVSSASHSPALGPSDSHHSRAPLCLLLSMKQAKDWSTDPQAWSDLCSSASDLVAVLKGDRVLRGAHG